MSGAVREEATMYVEITYPVRKKGTIREHSVTVDGDPVYYQFRPGKKTEMPFSHGVKFCMEGFRVTDAKGQVYKSRAGVKTESEQGLTLKPGEIVANMEELTDQALVIRANQISGGEKFRRNHGKGKIIAFLLENSLAGTEDEDAKDEADGGDLEEISPEELAGINAQQE